MPELEWPLLVFREDGVLELCETLEDARREFEGVDVEARVFEFYDFSGCPAKPVFIEPNNYPSFLGLIRSVSSGVFEFERDPDLETDPIDVAVLETAILEKNERFEDLIQVRKHLESRGCEMDLSRRLQETEEAEQVSGGNGGQRL